MKQEPENHSEELNELKSICRSARKKNIKKPDYPPRAKEIVKILFRSGQPVSEITRSSGLSYSCVRKWTKESSLISKESNVRILKVDPTSKQSAPEIGAMILSLETHQYRVTVYSSDRPL